MKAPFELTVEIRDRTGNVASADSSTAVTVKVASGGGRLAGTLVRTAVAGVIRFDDLECDLWENVTLELTASGLAPVTTGSIPVRPLLRLRTARLLGPAADQHRPHHCRAGRWRRGRGLLEAGAEIRAELPAGGTATGGLERAAGCRAGHLRGAGVRRPPAASR